MYDSERRQLQLVLRPSNSAGVLASEERRRSFRSSENSVVSFGRTCRCGEPLVRLRCQDQRFATVAECASQVSPRRNFLQLPSQGHHCHRAECVSTQAGLVPDRFGGASLFHSNLLSFLCLSCSIRSALSLARAKSRIREAKAKRFKRIPRSPLP